MLVEGGHEVHHHDHWGHDLWGRRLMASASDDNETEEKNCTEPGKGTEGCMMEGYTDE